MRSASLHNGRIEVIERGIGDIEVHRNGLWGYDVNDRVFAALLHRVFELEDANSALQSQIDNLMLEYCPEEMSQQQVEEWARHQVSMPDSDIELDE